MPGAPRPAPESSIATRSNGPSLRRKAREGRGVFRPRPSRTGAATSPAARRRRADPHPLPQVAERGITAHLAIMPLALPLAARMAATLGCAGASSVPPPGNPLGHPRPFRPTSSRLRAGAGLVSVGHLHPGQSRFVTVADCPIHYLLWPARAGGACERGLLFVHGGGAHAHWWSFIAPYFTRDFRVAAIDLSGMGDSGRRATTARSFAPQEMRAVIAEPIGQARRSSSATASAAS